jgi:gluconate kinase
MLLVLFGLPGSGKSYIGKLLETEYGFYHYEGDKDIMPSIRAIIRQNRPVPEPLREAHFEKVCTRIASFKTIHPNLVVTRALTKEKDRKQILGCFPEAKFIWVQADLPLINSRLVKRKDHLVNEFYAASAIRLFEPPAIPCLILENNAGMQKLRNQLDDILGQLNESIHNQLPN